MYNHYEYCEELAKKLKPISHSSANNRFFKATEQTELYELEENISNVNGTILIAIDGSLIEFDYKFSDNIIQQPYYNIVIAQQTISSDSSTIIQSQQNCKVLAKEIIKKMLSDACQHKNGTDEINLNSFTIEGFGPIASLFYGVILSFSLNEPMSYKLNPSLWL